jgi:plastocyanin
MRLACLILSIACLSAVQAAEEKPAKAAADASGEQTWTGQLAAKGMDAKENVAAIMKVTKGDKVEWVNLLATGDNAKVLDEWAVKRGSITVFGTLTDEGIKVSKVDADSAKGPVEKKKKKK